MEVKRGTFKRYSDPKWLDVRSNGNKVEETGYIIDLRIGVAQDPFDKKWVLYDLATGLGMGTCRLLTEAKSLAIWICDWVAPWSGDWGSQLDNSVLKELLASMRQWGTFDPMSRLWSQGSSVITNRKQYKCTCGEPLVQYWESEWGQLLFASNVHDRQLVKTGARESANIRKQVVHDFVIGGSRYCGHGLNKCIKL